MKALKRLIPRLVTVLVGLVAGMAVSLALFAATEGSLYKDTLGLTFDDNDFSHDSDALLIENAYRILGYIKDSDFSQLSQSVHPGYGVVFSPYATITLSSNKCFTAEQLAAFGTDKTVYVWGVFDGSGNPIEMTPAEYFSRFVFDKDFTKTPLVGVDHVVRTGNALENFKEVFPNARFVDFHIPSGDKETEDTGWKSLRLGFEEYEGAWRLTLILHSEWTI